VGRGSGTQVIIVDSCLSENGSSYDGTSDRVVRKRHRQDNQVAAHETLRVDGQNDHPRDV
jgi:hypothetical protein